MMPPGGYIDKKQFTLLSSAEIGQRCGNWSLYSDRNVKVTERTPDTFIEYSQFDRWPSNITLPLNLS